MEVKQARNAVIVSNVLFLIPIIIAVKEGLYFYALLLTVATSISIIYHASHEKYLGSIDRTLATTVIIANLYLCYLSGFKEPFFATALLFVVFAFYFFFKAKNNYSLNHALWHVCSVVITLMCVLAYVL